MIETEGGGIRKIFNFQRQRLFPMPDYDITDNKCKLTIQGKIMNLDFGRILIKNPTLNLADIILLDRVQKNDKNLLDEQIIYLKKKKFVEGRKPNLFLSLKVIQPLNNQDLKSTYLANKSFDDKYFKDKILEYLQKFGKTKRKEIDNHIIPKLSEILSSDQKKSKVTNFLSALRMEGKIESLPGYFWQLI